MSDQPPPNPFPAPEPVTTPFGAPATGPWPPVPGPALLPPGQRLRQAVTARNQTDYQFEFWSALGWTLLTCGVFGFYVTYQLFRRSAEHNRRRIEVLDSVNALAWERAVAAGRSEELTPWFRSVSTQIDVLRRVATEFRDPALWTVITAVTGTIGSVLSFVFLDQDLVAHEAAERAAEDQLASLLASLGTPVVLPPAPPPKGPHNIGGRVAALLGSCGLYGLWWLNDVMVQGNDNFQYDWVREDAFLGALGA